MEFSLFSWKVGLDKTNVTWLTTCYRYDDLGRQVATWQTNYAAQVGLPATRTCYDALGRVIARIDQLGNTTTSSYSPDGRTVFVHNPNTSTRITTRSPDGDLLSITGSAVTPEFNTYGILPDGTRWSKTVQGETAASPRFTKRYENLLGQTIREERSGFQGAVLATVHTYDSLGRLVTTVADYEPTTEYTYDTLGNRIATTLSVGRAAPCPPPSPDTQWRKSESLSHIAIIDGTVWLTQTNIVSCSDSAIAPLSTSSARQLNGLTPALPARSRTADVRGNVTESETLVDSSIVTSRQKLPYVTNKSLSVSRYGVNIMDVSFSAVTNTVSYDPLGRQIANTDGRGNTRRNEYNAIGQRAASIDALGNRTAYVYDRYGNLAAVTNALGYATIYEYDLRGHKTLEYGATYPVRYTYDVFGNKTTMATFRDAGGPGFVPAAGDTTTWLYDEASGSMTNKVYADGKGPSYAYTPNGKLARRTWARGITTDYSYDGWGSLTNTVYSDDTPTVSASFDVLGRQVETHDAAGVTTYSYDAYDSLISETMIGIAGTNEIIRHWDTFGRSTGYSLAGRDTLFTPNRQTTLAYDPATGRLMTMLTDGSGVSFAWSYLPGSDLKSSLTYPNGLTASWRYDANGLLLQVCNSFPTNVISQYDYTYDNIGRRVAIACVGSAMSETRTDNYEYNSRNELISATKNAVNTEYLYAYDDIGNRIVSNEIRPGSTNIITRAYASNNLNQYAQISNLCINCDFYECNPQYDDDGNQVLIQTSTGRWSVTYNGENRPVYWSNGVTNIVMTFDGKGRRVQYLETSGCKTNATNTFSYDNFLLVTRNRHAQDGSFIIDHFVWDVTEPVATRPIVFSPPNAPPLYYSHDGNKNVTDLTMGSELVAEHNEYTPSVILTSRNDGVNESGLNSLKFSSEYYDETLALVYYNYRHLSAEYGRWMNRDVLEEQGGNNVYLFCWNNPLSYTDQKGAVAPALIPLALLAEKVAEAVLETVAAALALDAVVEVADDLMDKACRPCLPCNPPKGTLMYQIHTSHCHAGMCPHIHYFVVSQSPPIAGCRCWADRNKVSPSSGLAPDPTAIPYVQPTGGGRL